MDLPENIIRDMIPDQHTWPVWATEPVEIVASSTVWIQNGVREIASLTVLLAPFSITEIQHIGSTSVPGLAAKPILDLMARAGSFDRIEEIAAVLAPLGWNYVPPELDDIAGRRFFVRVKDDRRIAHLHILSPDNKKWEEQLRFRDELIRNPEVAGQYAALKVDLSIKYQHDREAYSRTKTTFIETVLSGALAVHSNPGCIPAGPAPKVQLIFATNNRHKVEEIQFAIGNILEVISLDQAGIDIDIPEPHDTLEANASEKSGVIFRLTGMNCFSEDTGLEVEALNGEPGVRSARYAGEGRGSDDNIAKLLGNLQGHTNRKARFRTVISLLMNGQEHLFEGICDGRILSAPTGSGGFGYDPVFAPDGESRSFGEMSLEEKAHFSHRRKAADKLITFLRE